MNDARDKTIKTSIPLLLIEDDRQLARLLVGILDKEGFATSHAENLDQAKALFQQKPFTLAVVDVMLGADNGLDFVRHAKERAPDTGIIISAKDSPMERVLGIEMGADDYVTKPLETLELVARARRLAGRLQRAPSQGMSDMLVEFGDFTLDAKLRRFSHAQAGEIALTGKEFDLLLCLTAADNRVISRDEIANAIHGRDWQALDRSIDVMISNLRIKLRKIEDRDYIRTVRGAGYAFAEVLHRRSR
ncbi:MAG: response regulator transcription factor [Candidatus Protistobacter heckmanni]|nr:response regulator transcription factor [Candidatus Protistobacter heckmanni]